MKLMSAKAFLNRFDEFLNALEDTPLVKKTVTKQEYLMDLFRLWYMDCREQEIIEAAESRQDNDPFGLGDMLGD